MTLDLSGLEAVKKRKPAKQKAEWAPLDLATLHPGTFLAVDQSISAFGLVLFEVTPEYRCAVHLAQQFSEPPYVGHEGLLQNVDRLEDRLAEYVAKWMPSSSWGRVRAVHEMTPVNKGRMARPEVSLLTAYAFRRATKQFELLPSVGRQTHSKLICGEANADKKVHHAALKELFDGIRGADELITNGATRDALSVALAAAHRGF